MSERWRRKAGAETYTVRDCPHYENKVDLLDGQGFRHCITREIFERDYERVPEGEEGAEPVFPEPKVTRVGIVVSEETLNLADKLAEVVKIWMDGEACQAYHHDGLECIEHVSLEPTTVEAALSAYLEARKPR